MSGNVSTGLILEDNSIAQSFVKLILEECFPGIELKCASSLHQALNMLESFRPQIALVDLSLPDGNGEQLLKVLCEFPDCISIVMTAHNEEESLYSALRAGAEGYLLKNQPRDQIKNSLLGLINDQVAMSPQMMSKMCSYFSAQHSPNLVSDDESRKQTLEMLSDREIQVLGYLGKGLTTRQLAEVLNLSQHTVSSHIKNIYSKLEISSRAEAAYQAVLLGLSD